MGSDAIFSACRVAQLYAAFFLPPPGKGENGSKCGTGPICLIHAFCRLTQGEKRLF
jgi:hypothetical protein